VCGTDAGVGPNKPHDVRRYAISEYLPTLGMNNAEALRANTSVAADICGLGSTKGVIAVGMDADIIAASGNPSTTSAACNRSVPSLSPVDASP
jgi:imidazolonepropionase-like amidohydrolase